MVAGSNPAGPTNFSAGTRRLNATRLWGCVIRHLSIAAVVLAAAFLLRADDDRPPLRHITNEAFGLGERLEYSVGYKFIRAGTAFFAIAKQPVMVAGRPCYDIRFEVASLKSLDFMYRVRDRYRTLVDIDGIFPWRIEQKIREGGFQKDFSASFDHVTKLATTTEGNFPIPAFVHDIVSAFYYIRALDLSRYKRGDVIYLQNFYDRETHDLAVKILGRQNIEVEAGTFRCVVVEPVVKSGSLFKFEGKLLLWLSDDDRRIPVKVSTKIPIGSIDAELTGYSGLRGPIGSRVSSPR